MREIRVVRARARDTHETRKRRKECAEGIHNTTGRYLHILHIVVERKLTDTNVRRRAAKTARRRGDDAFPVRPSSFRKGPVQNLQCKSTLIFPCLRPEGRGKSLWENALRGNASRSFPFTSPPRTSEGAGRRLPPPPPLSLPPLPPSGRQTTRDSKDASCSRLLDEDSTSQCGRKVFCVPLALFFSLHSSSPRVSLRVVASSSQSSSSSSSSSYLLIILNLHIFISFTSH